MSIQPTAGVSHRPDALTGNASRPVSFDYAEAAFPKSQFAQAVIDIALLFVGALLICSAAIAVASPVLIMLLFIFT